VYIAVVLNYGNCVGLFHIQTKTHSDGKKNTKSRKMKIEIETLRTRLSHPPLETGKFPQQASTIILSPRSGKFEISVV
jgi:hypothetical protein